MTNQHPRAGEQWAMFAVAMALQTLGLLFVLDGRNVAWFVCFVSAMYLMVRLYLTKGFIR